MTVIQSSAELWIMQASRKDFELKLPVAVYMTEISWGQVSALEVQNARSEVTKLEATTLELRQQLLDMEHRHAELQADLCTSLLHQSLLIRTLTYRAGRSPAISMLCCARPLHITPTSRGTLKARTTAA